MNNIKTNKELWVKKDISVGIQNSVMSLALVRACTKAHDVVITPQFVFILFYLLSPPSLPSSLEFISFSLSSILGCLAEP